MDKPEYGIERVPLDYLRSLTEAAQRKYHVGSRWRHYKGKEFIVTGFTTGEHMNRVYVRYAYPEDVVAILPGAIKDKWDTPMPAAIAEHEFSIEIDLWEEELATEHYNGARFVKVSD
jgi:hypothetical protein